MNEMLSILFKWIPSLLFEPIAVCAFLGLAAAAVMYWKQRTPLYWLIGLSILFMLGWRLGIQIVTSRYAAALIYPAVIAASFFCFQTERLVKYIPKFPEKWSKYVPYVFLIILFVSSIGQVLHLNPYGDYMIRVADLIKKDAQKRKNPHIQAIAQEHHRLSYYTGISVSEITYTHLPDEEAKKSIGNSVFQGVAEPAEHIYIVLTESLKRPKGYFLQDIPQCIRKRMHFLGEFYHNRKKRNVTRVYRFDAVEFFNFSFCPCTQNKAKVKTEANIRIAFDKICSKGDQFYKYAEDYYKKFEKLECPQLKDMPVGWLAWGSPGYEAGSHAELGVVKGADGKNIFRIKADKIITTYTNPMYPAKNWQVVMKVSGRKDTLFNFATFCYNAKYGMCAFSFLPAVKIPEDNKVYEYRCTIPEGFYSPETKYIRPTIYLTMGELYVHSIELYHPKK